MTFNLGKAPLNAPEIPSLVLVKQTFQFILTVGKQQVMGDGLYLVDEIFYWADLGLVQAVRLN